MLKQRKVSELSVSSAETPVNKCASVLSNHKANPCSEFLYNFGCEEEIGKAHFLKLCRELRPGFELQENKMFELLRWSNYG